MPGRLWAGLGRAARAALRSPWPLTCAVLLPFQLLMGWVLWKGLHLEPEPVLSRGVMELWVHGPQPPFAWVPFIHPPGYAVYMNVTDAVAGWLGMSPDALVLLQGWACRILLVLLVAWAVTRWAGPRAGLLAASLVALSPNGLRPFEHYPIASIRDIGSLFFPVWNREVATIDGRTVSLGEIEHEILRKAGEPRIHAAIVCASTSCPPLARRAFRAERLDADLDDAMRRWLASPDKGVALDRERNRVRVSEIFDWFEEDFEAQGGVLATIAGHVSEDDAAWLSGAGAGARIEYLDYDWTLNDDR